ncbi:hypothetical protein [Pedobacter sp. R-06]|uniref:hypothetical protein n=1 Tax=Pedobacter sp. R-06 TaxID=3404051 RepID=UPI003CF8E778
MESPKKDPLDFLNLPIAEVALTESFILRSKLMGFFTLNDIISSELLTLHEREDYSERWYYEFVSFLKLHNLTHLLET